MRLCYQWEDREAVEADPTSPRNALLATTFSLVLMCRGSPLTRTVPARGSAGNLVMYAACPSGRAELLSQFEIPGPSDAQSSQLKENSSTRRARIPSIEHPQALNSGESGVHTSRESLLLASTLQRRWVQLQRLCTCQTTVEHWHQRTYSRGAVNLG